MVQCSWFGHTCIYGYGNTLIFQKQRQMQMLKHLLRMLNKGLYATMLLLLWHPCLLCCWWYVSSWYFLPTKLNKWTNPAILSCLLNCYGPYRYIVMFEKYYTCKICTEQLNCTTWSHVIHWQYTTTDIQRGMRLIIQFCHTRQWDVDS